MADAGSGSFGAKLDMSGADSSPFGAELRAWRAEKGLTQKELGEQLGWSESFISDVERGSRGVRLDFAKKCDELFKTPATFVRTLNQMRRKSYPTFFAPIVEYEAEAVRIHGWSLGAIPGLLQTADYARAVIRARNPRDDEEAIEEKVNARLERQESLIRPDPPLMWYVIHEGVLRHIVGSKRIMAAQLDRLIKAAESPAIVIQVLPFTAHDHAGVEGPILLFEAPDGGATVGYTECHGGGRIVEHPDEVADLMTAVDMLRAISYGPRESIRLVKQIRKDLDGFSEVEL